MDAIGGLIEMWEPLVFEKAMPGTAEEPPDGDDDMEYVADPFEMPEDKVDIMAFTETQTGDDSNGDHPGPPSHVRATPKMPDDEGPIIVIEDRFERSPR